MYCSRQCRLDHQRLIHVLECSSTRFPANFAIPVEVLRAALSVFSGHDQQNNLIKNSNLTIFDLKASKDIFIDENLLAVINSLATSAKCSDFPAQYMKQLFEFITFDHQFKSNHECDFFFSFFRRQLQINANNQFEMTEHTREILPDKSVRWFARTIGSGLCLFASLFNHSCDANVKKVTVDNKIAFVVAKPVKAGEQLFINYGCSSARLSRKERQTMLQRYNFSCDCEACVNNYPRLQDLPKTDDTFIEPGFGVMETHAAVKIFKRNCDYIEENIKYHPCYETTLLMLNNDHLLRQISKSINETFHITEQFTN